MITLSKIPEHVAKTLPKQFLQWLHEDRTRTNYKIDLVSSPTEGNVPLLTTTGELEDNGKAAPAGEFVGDTDTQTLSNKTLITPTIADFTNAGHSHENAAGGGQIDEDALALTDVTTNNVTSTKHGFAPKSPNDTTKFLRGDATPDWAVPDHGSLSGLADDDHTQYLNNTRHDTSTRHVDATLATATWTNYYSSSTVTGWELPIRDRGLIYYKRIGNTVLVNVYLYGVSNSTSTSFTVPYSAHSGTVVYDFWLLGLEGSTWQFSHGLIDTGVQANLVVVYYGLFTGWAATGDKIVRGQFWYEAAS
jgi:hypothetical protein